MNSEAQGPRTRPRTRSIRRRIALLLAVPLVSLVALWGFAASTTLGAALTKLDVSTTYNKIGKPGSMVSIQLQVERALSTVVVASHGQEGAPQLTAQRKITDAVVATYQKQASSGSVQSKVSGTIRDRMRDFGQQLSALGSTRNSVDTFAMSPLQVIDAYGAMVGASFNLFSGLTIVNDLHIYRMAGGLMANSWSREYMLREDALLEALPPAQDGRMTLAEHSAFVGWSGAGLDEFQRSMQDLSGKVGAPFVQLSASQTYQQLRTVEQDVIATKPGSRQPAVNTWRSTATPMLNQWGMATAAAGGALADEAAPISQRIIVQLAVAGGLGLLAVAASIVISILFVRRLSAELGGLQQAAIELAERRLPTVVARLRRGEDVDVRAEAPPIDSGGTTEVARVAAAFSSVQRTAIDTAVNEAHLRKGISRVFLNLAWRSQSLLHRQLRMLDSMERKATDPAELEDLFRLDHLTTRMRRHAEGLVILSGAPAGRGWNQPVPLDDVLRGAVAEVEDYTRVDVVTSPTEISIAGGGVADLIHLLAELVENATAFSPPPTEVLVRGEMVGNGFAIEIVDRGIGLSHEELTELNHRLARPPEFDLADSDRLGLFVVSRLATRHGIRITLQPSAYGGTTAVVLLPHELVIGQSDLAMHQLNPPAAISGEAGESLDQRAWFEPAQIARTPVPPGEPVQSGPAADVAAVYERRTANGEFGAMTATAQAAPAAEADSDELPKRVRQRNLAPQLRKEPMSAPVSTMGFTDEEDERSPEQTRDLMNSLQSGWTLGRSDDESLPDSEDGIPFERRNEWGES